MNVNLNFNKLDVTLDNNFFLCTIYFHEFNTYLSNSKRAIRTHKVRVTIMPSHNSHQVTRRDIVSKTQTG